MQTPWQRLDFNQPKTLPKDEQSIYLSIAQGEGVPFPKPEMAKADLYSFRKLLEFYPSWVIIWKPVPPPPPVPKWQRQNGIFTLCERREDVP